MKKKTRHKPEVPDIDLAKAECIDHPLVLWVTIAILVGPQSVRNAFDSVYHWARKVVSGIDLPLVPKVAFSFYRFFSEGRRTRYDDGEEYCICR